MNALDTNILVRFFIENSDNPEDYRQHLIAVQLLNQKSFIAMTVILELAWVLKSHYQLNRTDIHTIITILCEIDHIIIEKQYLVVQALEYYLNGMDFADALHLLQSAHYDNFYTFDKKFIKKAKTLHLDNAVIEPTLF